MAEIKINLKTIYLHIQELPYHIYKMTQNTSQNRLNKESSMNCHTCKIQIKLGDSVVTKSSGKSSRLIRHESCAKRIGILS